MNAMQWMVWRTESPEVPDQWTAQTPIVHEVNTAPSYGKPLAEVVRKLKRATYRELADEMGVKIETIRRNTSDAVKARLVKRRKGKGGVVVVMPR